MPLMDNKMAILAEPFSHWNTICDGGEYNTVTKFLNLLSCGNSIMSNYLGDSVDENELDAEETLSRYPEVFSR